MAYSATLHVYTTRSFARGIGRIAKKIFEAQYPLTIQYVTHNGKGALGRAISHGTRPGDVLVGISHDTMPPSWSQYFLSLKNQPDMALHWPPCFKDDHIIPLSYTILGFVRHASMTRPITSFQDLVHGHQKIVLIDPRTSSPGLGFILWLYAVSEKESQSKTKADILKIFSKKVLLLKSKILTVAPSWSSAYAMFMQGEASIVLGYITSPAYHRIYKNETHYIADHMKEGHYLQYTITGIMKKTRHLDYAKAFIKILLSLPVQKAFINHDFSFPIIRLSPDLYPKEFKMPDIIHTYDAKKLHDIQKDLLNVWLDTLAS